MTYDGGQEPVLLVVLQAVLGTESVNERWSPRAGIMSGGGMLCGMVNCGPRSTVEDAEGWNVVVDDDDDDGAREYLKFNAGGLGINMAVCL